MTFGSLFGRTVSTFGRNFVPFMVLALIIYLPLYAYGALSMSSPPATTSPLSDLAAALGGDFAVALSFTTGLQTFLYVIAVGGALLSMILSGALTYGVLQDLAGKPASIGECLGVGLKRLLPVLGTALLSGLAVAGGFLLLVIPGLIVSCMLAVAVPVAVIEKLGPVDALKRSAALTGGFRWTIFGVVLVVGILQGGIGYALQMGMLDNGAPSMAMIRAFLLVSVGLSMIGGIINATLASIAYNVLRQVKEGVATQELAAVFE